MIGGEDIYKVVAAMAPLYLALILGYTSIRWLKMFDLEHCHAINRLNCYFIMPFFSFEFTAKVNPYAMNYRFHAADAIGKCIIGIVLALWANFSPRGNLAWSVTAFSLSSLNSPLVVGVPLLNAMYGELGVDLVLQSSVVQALLWMIALLFLQELRRARSVIDAITDRGMQNTAYLEENSRAAPVAVISFWSITKTVLLKLVKNPNAFSTVIGLIWALLENRWHFGMPSIIKGSIAIMSKAGSGIAMFTLGLFMGLQGRIIACGVRKTILGMVLRFVVGPASVAIGALALRLRGKVFCIAILQGALPHAVSSFVFAQEYGLHADVVSTAVIIGTVASLPLLLVYYAIIGVLYPII